MTNEREVNSISYNNTGATMTFQCQRKSYSNSLINFTYFPIALDQTVYQATDCYDLTNNCTYWAFDKKYCRTEDYAEWMSAACKESCGFCRGKQLT